MPIAIPGIHPGNVQELGRALTLLGGQALQCSLQHAVTGASLAPPQNKGTIFDPDSLLLPETFQHPVVQFTSFLWERHCKLQRVALQRDIKTGYVHGRPTFLILGVRSWEVLQESTMHTQSPGAPLAIPPRILTSTLDKDRCETSERKQEGKGLLLGCDSLWEPRGWDSNRLLALGLL